MKEVPAVEKEEVSSESVSAPSEIASRIQKLKDSSLAVIQRRERVPQPLFWSLFHLELKEVREMRKQKREELRALFGLDWA